ncbi:class I SAM-dependent methyltransferase [Bacillus sp. 1P06AnD]|uniref:class I SAM-dependent methyltransferase n=1 Tax=Bacillus sp. 1P06AnD TaxID=3132208 RepID=UPI0039A172DD
MREIIRNEEDVLNMLDALLKEKATFQWDAFYGNRERNVPFFKDAPDENLKSYFERGIILPCSSLELGCGPGRNAFFLEEQGCKVDAIDSSEEAIAWAKARAGKKESLVAFYCENIFGTEIIEKQYGLVYDSGCFHHIPPHRRGNYMELINKALAPGGHFGLVCFMVDGTYGGSSQSDWDVYRQYSMQGGMGYTEASLKDIFSFLEVVEMKPMKDVGNNPSMFGVDGLWTALFAKK